MYPRTTHSIGSISSRRHSVERPSAWRPRRWWGTIELVRANQNADRPVSTRPLSGISVDSTTSKVEIRSLATSRSRSSSSAYSSLTFPLPTCAASGMDGLLLPDERAQSLEDSVDVACVSSEVEDGIEIDAAGKLPIGPHELAEVLFLVPGAECVTLDEPVCLVPGQPRLDQREQQTLAEEEAVARVEIASHPFRPDDQAFDEPGETVEHVVECEERIRNDDALRRRVGDVSLVPERQFLDPNGRRRADDPREPGDAFGVDRVPLVWHRRRAFLVPAERLLDFGDLGPREVADLERELLERRRDERQGGELLGVAVALKDLGGDGRRLEPKPLAGDPLDLGVGRGVRADGPRKLSDPYPLQRLFEPRPVAVELERPPGELEAERGRLGMNPVRAADLERLPVLLGSCHDGSECVFEAWQGP